MQDSSGRFIHVKWVPVYPQLFDLICERCMEHVVILVTGQAGQRRRRKRGRSRDAK
jgi:hypothetical protein